MSQTLLRWLAFFWTIGPGVIIAARLHPRITGWAFVGLTLGAVIWIVAGTLAADYALVTQNAAIALINCVGIYRWLIWKGKGG